MTDPTLPDDEPSTEDLDDESLLPDQTRDDTDEGWGEAPTRATVSRSDELSAHDRWLLEQRPPHHGER